MGFQQGLSGLNAASRSLEAIGNNVANANTVGFKQSEARFSDVFAASISGGGASQIGIGTQLAAVAQQFTQGNITTSNNPLDIAINGDGFFRMSSGGTVTYGRNGQFELDKDGYIVNSNGSHLTGYPVDSKGNLVTGAPQDLQIMTKSLSPLASTNVNTELNLDAQALVPTTAFNATNIDPTMYNNASSVTVYDSLGVSHVMQLYYVKTATPGNWDVYATCDDTPLTTPATSKLGTLQFDSKGELDRTASGLPFPGSINVNPALDPSSKANALSINFDFANSTQAGAEFRVTKLYQDGYTAGELSGFVIAKDGTITGRYTNGQSASLGQIVLAKFQNPNGLQPLGNNVWAESASSGQPMIGAPGGGGLGALQSSAVEDSNVDLTAELVNMITAQRVYQANAQTIKTEDQVMQTLVNLR